MLLLTEHKSTVDAYGHVDMDQEFPIADFKRRMSSAGIDPLSNVVRRLYTRNADLRFYLPHLAWPVRNGEENAEWKDRYGDYIQLAYD